MTWQNRFRGLMGTSYEQVPVVPPTEAVSPLVPSQLDAPQPAMAMEESLIQRMRREELMSDAPVLSSENPLVRAAGFRDRFVPPVKNVEAETRARMQAASDAPVAPRPAPLIAQPPELQLPLAERWRRAINKDYELVPVQRKAMA